MKVIFLDIDGVLNSEKFFMEKARDIIALDKSKINLLKKIVDVTNAKIVLSSTWRMLPSNHPDYKALMSFFEEEGLSVYDKTPSGSNGRGSEIQQWLNNHPEVTDFVILDDDSYDMGDLVKYLVQPTWSGDGGLQISHVTKAINILQGNRA